MPGHAWRSSRCRVARQHADGHLRRLVLALGGLLSATGLSHAHGYFPPKYGGLMSEGGEISVELVAQAARTVLYVEDHGMPLATAGASGAIALGSIGGAQQVLALEGDGDNRLVGPPVQLSPGDRVVARAELADGNVVFVRFRVPQPGEVLSAAAAQARPGQAASALVPFARPFAWPMTPSFAARPQPSSAGSPEPQPIGSVP